MAVAGEQDCLCPVARTQGDVVKKTLWIFALAWFAAQWTYAQWPPVWRYWRTADGLGATWCFCGDYSPLGNLVVCHNNNTLSLLDGYGIRIIKGLPIRGEEVAKQDAGGNFWVSNTKYIVGSYNKSEMLGFYRFDRKGEKWTYFTIQGEGVEVVSNQMYNVYVFHDRNRLLFAKPDCVMELDPEQAQFTPILSAAEVGVPSFRSVIAKSFVKGYLVVYESGVLHFWEENESHPHRWQWKKYPFPQKLHDLDFFQIFDQPKGELHAAAHPARGYEYEFYCYRQDGWQRIAPDLASQDGWKDRLGRYWLLGENGSIFLYGREKSPIAANNEIFNDSFKMSKNFGENGKVFLVTGLGVACYMPPLWDRPAFLEREIYQKVDLLDVDGSGRVWMIVNGRLIRIDGEKQSAYDIPYPDLKNYQNQLVQLSDGRLFIGMPWDMLQLILFDPQTERFSKVKHPDRTFTSLGPNCWGKTGKPLIVKSVDEKSGKSFLETYDGREFQVVASSDRIPAMTDTTYYIQDVMIGNNGDLWMCPGDMDGPTLVREGRVTNYPNAGDVPFSTIVYFLDRGDGKIWAAGEMYLAEYNRREWKILFDCEKKHVIDMTVARNGDVWLACGDGIWRRHQETWTFMTSDDGLPAGRIKKVIEDNRGRIWINSNQGIFLFYPDADIDPPQTSLDPNKNLREFAPYRDIPFVYSGVDKWKYTETPRLRYSYRIDEENWKPYTQETIALVHNVSAGEHVFEVRAMDINYNVDDTPSRWEFTVLLPWYREPIFIGIVSLSSLLTIFFAGYAINRHRLLQHANIHLNQFNAELQEANAQLIQLDQMKSAFVSQASHDLRTPLTAIKGSLDNLIVGIAGDLNEKQARIMERATKSVDRLTNLINDVLDLSRIESGRIVLEKSDIPFKTLVENSINENRPAAALKQIPISFHAEEGDYIWRIDGGKMERVVGELISNAIKYTPVGGTVHINLNAREGETPAEPKAGMGEAPAEPSAQTIILSVRDSGIGMTPEECAKIWERFYRTAASRKFAKGSGLGLSIAKELVELHGGTLTVTSRLGEGTTFTLTLPKTEINHTR